MHRIKTSLITLCVLVAASVVAIPAMAHGTATKGTVVTVTAGKPAEFAFKLSTKTVKAGSVTFKVTDGGALGHSFKVCTSAKGGTANSCAGKGTAVLAHGKSATLVVMLTKGTHEYLCTVPGHAAGGMKGILKVS
jgi:uncharacterized cupredoxin-like copper-binding protein